MAARLDSVCKYICNKSDWTLSNLELQKIVYMAQMIFMGKYPEGRRLVDTVFEAWDYGPVSPNLYHKLKGFGAEPVADVFDDARSFKIDDPRRAVLDEVCVQLIGRTPGDLVEITHWPKGAWAKHYVPGARRIRIPDEDIRREYFDRRSSTKE